MTTDTVKNAKMTTESVVNFVFFETLTTEKSATGLGWLWFGCSTVLPSCPAGSRFCQIPISSSTIGQTVEHSKSKSAKPSLSSFGTPCRRRTKFFEKQQLNFGVQCTKHFYLHECMLRCLFLVGFLSQYSIGTWTIHAYWRCFVLMSKPQQSQNIVAKSWSRRQTPAVTCYIINQCFFGF